MVRVARNTILLLLLLLNICWFTQAASYGLSLGSWSSAEGQGSLGSGLQVYVGGTLGLASRIEAEVFSVIQATPDPFSTLHCGMGLTFALAAPREFASHEATLYYNAYLSAGFLTSLDEDPLGSIYVRITPISIGGPYYGKRERAASLGALYDLHDGSFSLFWNLFLLDFYI